MTTTTTDITYRSDFNVQSVGVLGDDLRVCQAARVSTQGIDSYDSGESEGLINFLMANRHGSPFEHVVYTWLISAPIFVWREFHRHRIASYNEESGRYKQLEPVFYIPPRHRPLQQVGKPGAYEFIPGTDEQYYTMVPLFQNDARRQYQTYEALMRIGIAKEVARMELPLNIFSSCYVTMNSRALMNFLSLRTKSDDAAYKSFPQWEINQVADQMEETFSLFQPLTHAAFVKSGRVQP